MLELNFLPFPTLETEGLILRKVTMADSQDVLTLRSNIEAMRYIGKPVSATLDEARDLISRIQDGLENNTAIGWAISLKTIHNLLAPLGFIK